MANIGSILLLKDGVLARQVPEVPLQDSFLPGHFPLQSLQFILQLAGPRGGSSSLLIRRQESLVGLKNYSLEAKELQTEGRSRGTQKKQKKGMEGHTLSLRVEIEEITSSWHGGRLCNGSLPYLP
ncbi:hypothetical protein LIER_08239 [Lithospermum erythrorhizon]|uniref:Uncharacterized protein n=1 Tax=Lithospermum erythrorhizon TaxID=34254 RepID=A0AAV3PD78_LITER